MATHLSTNQQVSPDSGDVWTRPGAWWVAPGVHRVPLPLPADGLQAVNVYVVERPDGLDLIDGGWAIDGAIEVLTIALRSIGHDVRDIRRFLVTHVHRDHYTLARVLATQYGAEVVLGSRERAALEIAAGDAATRKVMMASDLVRAGGADLAEEWLRVGTSSSAPGAWADPDVWLHSDGPVPGPGARLRALHTPGHTAGHFVFADLAAELLFAGDHVLPTITPSIGFESPRARDPLGDFLRSLAKLRVLPDMMLLPAHGPVASSTHARLDALTEHHEERLEQTVAAVPPPGATAHQVAKALPWTRRELAFDGMDVFNRALATLETSAHLDVLAARGDAVAHRDTSTTTYRVARA